MEEQVTEQNKSGNPICRERDIPMTLRTNRMNREDFWGCMTFPCCKFTLPLEMHAVSSQNCADRAGGGPDQEGETRQGHDPEHAQETITGTRQPEFWLSKLRRPVAADRWFRNPDRCRFRGSGVPGECEVEHGGDGDVDADAPCQGQLQAGQDHVRALRGRASPDRSPDESCEDHFSHMFDNDGEGARSVISGSKAARDASLAGKKRRNNLKKGIIRRFVGHTRAVLASVCLATAAYAGATLAGVTASTLTPRPD